MITIPDKVKEIINRSPYLRDAFAADLLNLSSLARKLQPQIEEELEKEVSTNAVFVALQRYSKVVEPFYKNEKEASYLTNSSLLFVITGGTIDSYYNGTKDTVEALETSAIPDYINSLKLYEKTNFSQVCMKDSRELTKKDLEAVHETIEKASEQQIIVTHGTYTMADTARYLKSKLKRNDQTILFTGSMIPLSFINSDAPFNLGYSIAKVRELRPGIYVCMNAKVFDPSEVSKLIHEGRFMSLFNQE